MSEPNPYASPTAALPATGDRAAFSELVHAWEKLQLFYNSIFLPGIGVLLLWITHQGKMTVEVTLETGSIRL